VGSRDLCKTSSELEKKVQVGDFFVFSFKLARRKPATLEPLVDLLAFVFGKLRTKNNIIS